MKILLTGGGTGGHIYPIFAVAQAINDVAEERKIMDVKLYFMSDQKYNERQLFNNRLIFKQINSGKMRRYFSVLNFLDVFKTFFAIIKATIVLFFIYPDVVFGKGGYVSFPALFAARILGIPVIIHESDSVPGRVNKWAAKFAERVAVSYPSAAQFFPADKVAHTGNPVRKEIQQTNREGAFSILQLEQGVPTLLIIGGSLGSQMINETIVDALPALVGRFQIIHQTGKNNIEAVQKAADSVLRNNPNRLRYHAYDYLNDEMIAMAAGAADIVISRAGSAIFEIALWGRPSVIIPIPEEVSHDQRTNAYSYASTGAAVVMEEKNLTQHLLTSELNRLIDNPAEMQKMSAAAKSFGRTDSARIIADEIVSIAYTHQK